MKVLLVHPGKQHSFETAKALKEAGVFYKYVTTVYDKDNSLTNKIKHLLKGKNLKKANTRKCPYLKDEEVIQIYEWWGLLVLLISKLPFLEIPSYTIIASTFSFIAIWAALSAK